MSNQFAKSLPATLATITSIIKSAIIIDSALMAQVPNTNTE
ncbi:hypothetical protein [Chitinophaga sancti]|uniref:Uncharacterized protein n=1 Tax=Chitinophaga sancti TaxID=1004 RepID=A0ABZ0XGA5_9BACT|nr:hypothetical protein [Chitinophaga sancti]WQD64716.1 hypothetical protein U0033_09940 [Chitinophaga sancti]WQG89662.1 hypothetical protein SR876_32535 [Chitinophaga sancti]